MREADAGVSLEQHAVAASTLLEVHDDAWVEVELLHSQHGLRAVSLGQHQSAGRRCHVFVRLCVLGFRPEQELGVGCLPGVVSARHDGVVHIVEAHEVPVRPGLLHVVGALARRHGGGLPCVGVVRRAFLRDRDGLATAVLAERRGLGLAGRLFVSHIGDGDGLVLAIGWPLFVLRRDGVVLPRIWLHDDLLGALDLAGRDGAFRTGPLQFHRVSADPRQPIPRLALVDPHQAVRAVAEECHDVLDAVVIIVELHHFVLGLRGLWTLGVNAPRVERLRELGRLRRRARLDMARWLPRAGIVLVELIRVYLTLGRGGLLDHDGHHAGRGGELRCVLSRVHAACRRLGLLLAGPGIVLKLRVLAALLACLDWRANRSPDNLVVGLGVLARATLLASCGCNAGRHLVLHALQHAGQAAAARLRLAIVRLVSEMAGTPVTLSGQGLDPRGSRDNLSLEVRRVGEGSLPELSSQHHLLLVLAEDLPLNLLLVVRRARRAIDRGVRLLGVGLAGGLDLALAQDRALQRFLRPSCVGIYLWRVDTGRGEGQRGVEHVEVVIALLVVVVLR